MEPGHQTSVSVLSVCSKIHLLTLTEISEWLVLQSNYVHCIEEKSDENKDHLWPFQSWPEKNTIFGNFSSSSIHRTQKIKVTLTSTVRRVYSYFSLKTSSKLTHQVTCSIRLQIVGWNWVRLIANDYYYEDITLTLTQFDQKMWANQQVNFCGFQ